MSFWVRQWEVKKFLALPHWLTISSSFILQTLKDPPRTLRSVLMHSDTMASWRFLWNDTRSRCFVSSRCYVQLLGLYTSVYTVSGKKVNSTRCVTFTNLSIFFIIFGTNHPLCITIYMANVIAKSSKLENAVLALYGKRFNTFLG